MPMNRTLRSLVALMTPLLVAPLLLVPGVEPGIALAAPAEQEACSRSNEPPPPIPGDPSTGSFWGRYRQPPPPA
jgi:hypothetical protein